MLYKNNPTLNCQRSAYGGTKALCYERGAYGRERGRTFAPLTRRPWISNPAAYHSRTLPETATTTDRTPDLTPYEGDALPTEL